MKIRSFKGHTLERIYDAIHEEMGADAVVINTYRPSPLKALMPSFMGGGYPHEVIAITDDESGERHTIAKLLGSDDLRQLSGMNSEKMDNLEKEFAALRSEIQEIARPAPTVHTDSPSIGGLPAFSEHWDPLFIQRIMATRPDFMELNDRTKQREALASLIPVVEDFKVRKDDGPNIVVLAGPTGSGKTTTLAKLAARWSLGAKLKVGIITTDTYRVAAVDQIREYAVLLGLELKIAFSAAEAVKAIRAFADKDVILVDTVGRSHYDESGMKALHGILKGLGRTTTLLLVPATWDRADVPKLLRDFKTEGSMHLVVTKLDETQNYDVLTYVSTDTSMPIAFLTDGQRVPQDIRDAQAKHMAGLLVPILESKDQ